MAEADVVIADSGQKEISSAMTALAQAIRGGAIIAVADADQAKLSERAGARAVVVNEGYLTGVARTYYLSLVKEIKKVVSVPVIAQARVGHFAEAQILESLGVNYIDETEELPIVDGENHIRKHSFGLPFVCGCRQFSDALLRIGEGATVIRTVSDVFGGGDIGVTVKRVKQVMAMLEVVSTMSEETVVSFAEDTGVPQEIVVQAKLLGRLPVPFFASGGIANPMDAALMMHFGCDGVFVDREIFEYPNAYSRVAAIVRAVAHYNDQRMWAEICPAH